MSARVLDCFVFQNLFDRGGEMRNLTLSCTHFLLWRSVRDCGMFRSLNTQMGRTKNFLPAAMMECCSRDRFMPLVINMTPQWDESCRVYSGTTRE